MHILSFIFIPLSVLWWNADDETRLIHANSI